MALTITKKDTKSAVKQTVEKAGAAKATARVEAIDYLGQKDAEVKSLATKLKILKAEVDSEKEEFYKDYVQDDPKVNDLAPDEKMVMPGADYVAEIGKKSTSRTIIDNSAVFVALENIKPGLALELLKFNLTDLDKYLSEAEQKAFVQKTTGATRPVTFKRISK